MKWTDIEDIAISLEKYYPAVDNLNIRYTDLFKWVVSLNGFDDDHARCNERILQAIQTAWLEEREEG